MHSKNRPTDPNRRAVLGGGLAACLTAVLPRAEAAHNRIDRSRISAITDEIARDPKGAIDFAKKYRISWLELRSVPGARKEYFMLPEADLKQAAKEFRDGGVGISFLNTSMFKYWLPGTEPARASVKKDPTRFENRAEELKRAANAAHILGVRKVRVFTFMRTNDPAATMPRIVEHLNELAAMADREKIDLLIENEGACNVSSAAELAAVVKQVTHRRVGINWDPLNSAHTKEIAFPDGYELLPAKRVGNVQIKGKSILPGPELLDWSGIFKRLEKDGYKGQVGLETHIFGEIQVQKSHESMQAILQLIEGSHSAPSPSA
ncbi:MAG: sugar phosphate isomerase/epimerase family protein [Bryobacteraceae bacterium]